ARSFPAEQVYPWLTLATGLVALGLGAGLFVSRLRARQRGLDPWHGHTHPWDGRVGELVDNPHSHAHGHGHDWGAEAEPAGGGVAVMERTDVVLGEDDATPMVLTADPTRGALSRRGLMALAIAGG